MSRKSTDLMSLDASAFQTPPNDPITVDDLLKRYADLDAQERHAKEGKEEIKAALNVMRDLGQINDKVQAAGYSASYSKRSTWVYSDAVKNLQHLEQVEGVANKRTTYSWKLCKTAE